MLGSQEKEAHKSTINFPLTYLIFYFMSFNSRISQRRRGLSPEVTRIFEIRRGKLSYQHNKVLLGELYLIMPVHLHHPYLSPSTICLRIVVVVLEVLPPHNLLLHPWLEVDIAIKFLFNILPILLRSLIIMDFFNLRKMLQPPPGTCFLPWISHHPPNHYRNSRIIYLGF